MIKLIQNMTQSRITRAGGGIGALVLFLSLMVGGLQAQAVSSLVEDSSDENLTLDEETNLLWMDLDETTNISWNQMNAALTDSTQYSGKFFGFRRATEEEIRALWGNADLGSEDSNLLGLFDGEKQQAFDDYVRLTGLTEFLTGNIGTIRGQIGFYDRSFVDVGVAAANLAILRDSDYGDFLDRRGVFKNLRVGTSRDEMNTERGHFIVRGPAKVPAPYTLMLTSFGLLALGYKVVRRQRD